MENRIQQCALAFQNLLDIRYDFIIGRKGRTIDISLTFDRSEFVHLLGLHKLSDNYFLRTAARERIFDAAVRGRLSEDVLSKSAFYSSMENRIGYFMQLESILDDNRLIFQYNPKNNTFSLIQADFLLRNDIEGREIYVFLSRREQEQQFFCRSFFPKENRDYTVGQCKYTLLYKRKTNLRTGASILQYDRIQPTSERI